MQQLHSRSVIALSIAAALAVPATAMANTEAAQSDDVSTMDTITVLGQAYRNTATKTALMPEETPQSITTIDNETLEMRGVNSVNEALRYVPGVNTELRGGAVKLYDTFNIRGFDVEKSYYDGLALQGLTGWNVQPQIDPIAIEQIEVFKGPTSVLYGAMSPGGMVNIIAKAPQKERSTDVAVSTGSHNLKEASIDTTGQVGDSDFAYRIIAKASERDSQVGGIKETRYLIAPSLDWYASEDTLVNFNLYYQRDPEAGSNAAVPGVGTMYNNPTGVNFSPNTFLGDHNWNEMDREFFLAGYKINHNINDSWTFLQNARYMNASLSQKNVVHTAYDENDPELLHRYAYSTEEESQGFIIDNQLSGVINVANVEHNVLFGVDYQRLTGSSLAKYYFNVDPINVNNPDNNQINPSDLVEDKPSRDDEDIKVEQAGIYFQDQVRLGQLVLIGGGRFDSYKSEHVDVVDGANKIDQTNFSYRFGGLYEFDNGLSPFFSYATSFEPIAGSDRHGNAFKPSEAKQIEAGVKYMSADMSKTATISAFHLVKENALTADPESIEHLTQAGEITSQGIEFEGQWFATDSLDLSVNYTFLDMEITENNDGLEGKTPIRTPKHSASAWANYHVYNGMLSGMTFGTGVRYIGETHVDAANTDMVPDYTLVDLAVKYDLGEVSPSMAGVSASLTATNLFDKEYYSCWDSMNCWVGAEQTVEAKVNFNF
ncbi:TonB-dependent siderophore receptor [Photobacterium sanctipauli]|uniref:TonB-dependent siderophore receptor n=1 Tax=Photobacterium sanctipauli TaxID=1342794 RepID=A0A2T3NUA8_9GAMM|nr:TonB-dependent siderophore receptor [Photobacterium sanctipauli]PSW19847.1 TonB-dependent siderophore receptor [Photobacterium sanctipauli]